MMMTRGPAPQTPGAAQHVLAHLCARLAFLLALLPVSSAEAMALGVSARQVAQPPVSAEQPEPLASSRLGNGLAFRWAPELSRAEPYEAQAFHGETFTLAATPRQYGHALTGLDASVKLYWQTPGMEPTKWYVAPGEYDPATGTLSVTWTPTMDVGGDRVTFFLALEQGDAVAYRVHGRLRLKPSPGFNPAELVPEDVRQELVDAIAAEVKDWADATYQPKGDYLTAEADPTVSAWAKAAQKPTYAWAEILGRPTSWAWEAITGKPTVYPPAAHTHDGSYLKLTGGTMTGTILSALSKASDPGLTITLGQGDRYYAKHTQAGIQARRALSDPEEFYAFFSVSGTNQIARLGDLEPLATKAALAAKADKTHTHTQAQVTGLTAALSQKANATHTHVAADITNLSATLNPLYAAKSHAHPIAEVTGLQAELNGKSPVGHGHAMIDVEGLTDALGGYLPLTGGTVTGDTTIMGTRFTNSGWLFASNIAEGGLWISAKYAAKEHTHDAADVATGTLNATRLPVATAGMRGAVACGDGLKMGGNATAVMSVKPATASALGGVKVGDGLSVAADGTLSAGLSMELTHDAAASILKGSESLSFDVVDDGQIVEMAIADGSASPTLRRLATQAYVDDHASTAYTLPPATASTLGGVKIDGVRMGIDEDGAINPAVCVNYNWVPYILVEEDSGLTFGTYSDYRLGLAPATASTIGGVKVGAQSTSHGGMDTAEVVTTIDENGYLNVSLGEGLAYGGPMGQYIVIDTAWLDAYAAQKGWVSAEAFAAVTNRLATLEAKVQALEAAP